jgi:hypothetical protein
MKKMLSITIIALVILSVMGWQHWRYLDARRNNVQDQQPLQYGSDAFHTITLFAVHEGEGVIAAARNFIGLLELNEAAKVIYVGRAAFASGSTPISAKRWSGVVMMMYPSRSVFEAIRQQRSYGAALGRFARTYTWGMRRPQWTNILLPQVLLVTAISDWVQNNPVLPLHPMPEKEMSGRRLDELYFATTSLRALSDVNNEALVVFNLTRAGTPEQQASDKNYTSKMIARMARGGYGPMHVGEAVILEGSADFEQVAIVYYPGTNYFADLLSSRFFQEIIGDKQLGDNLSVPTVPILRQVRKRRDDPDYFSSLVPK